tara:strand:- start:3121 stop:4245 length:1125 start_codon:yes stop_codon:yes gene_type:complete
MTDREKTIVVWRSAALGDFILACPALYEIRKNFPDRRVLLLTISSGDKKQRDKVEKIYASSTVILPWVELAKPALVDEYIVLQDTSLASLSNLKKEISKHEIDFSVIMLDPCAPYLGRLKKILMMKFISPFTKIYGWRSRGSLNSNNKKQLKTQGLLKHHVHGPLTFLNEMETKHPYPRDSEVKFQLSPSEEDEIWAKNYLVESDVVNDEFIIFGPGAIHDHKMWPLENFIRLASMLCQDSNYKIIILGTKQDYSKAESIKGIAPSKICNLAGSTSIGQSAALMKKAKLFIGNDGGAAHLADAMGCKCISIIPGIEYPDSIEPWNSKVLSIREEVYCAPCYNFIACENKEKFICMKDISVNKVMKNINIVIEMK